MIAGIHLVQDLAAVGTLRRSAVARLDAGGRLVALDHPDDDDALLGAVGDDLEYAVVDAPLAVPDKGGRRDVERVLAWCDIPVFPASRRRLEALHGGLRGERLAPELQRRARRGAWEASPDQVLRQLLWERAHPPGGPPVELGEYRAQWAGLRAPRYRPKAAGRARPAGLLPAWELLAGAVDMAGWAPRPDGSDWEQVADAAALDALCCALAGLRAAAGTAARVGDPLRGRMLVPAGPELAGRLAATVDRMRAAGEIAG